MAVKFANRMANLEASEIREILKVTQNPEIISFAGGLPAPELFPVKEISSIACELIATEGSKVLQYATTEGLVPLREKIAKRMNRLFKTEATSEDILITNGSQQGLDLTGKIFLNEGDVVLCESPSYLGAINALKAYSPKFVEVPTDEQGIIPEELEKILATTPNVKLLYVIPDFQNPTGISWTLERRLAVIKIIDKYDLPVIEDNPYGELRFEGETLPALFSLDKKGLVILLGTFSKTFCPGLRIGWIVAHKNILSQYLTVKQSADLHTSILDQALINAYMDKYSLDEHVQTICALYRERRDLILKMLAEKMPASVKFTHPNGGLFVWLTLPENINSRDVFTRCIENKVAFVPGDAFYPTNQKFNKMRINFSNMPNDRIVEGVERMATVIKELIK